LVASEVSFPSEAMVRLFSGTPALFTSTWMWGSLSSSRCERCLNSAETETTTNTVFRRSAQGNGCRRR
jgi:hypothetical protein